MIDRLTVITTDKTDPYYNLALEEYLLHAAAPGECILYLWQNQRTVVIGRNQHAASECRIQALAADGGHLARRLSGGGAVYHDLGNLNFTFLALSEDFDVSKQTQVILRAVQAVGIHAEKTGRNDLTVDGKKFSGHAYYHSGGKSCHHGTLMVSVDKVPLDRYLNVSPLKLSAKGVKSVRSRVCNLTDMEPGVTIDGLKAALIGAFGQAYGLPVEYLTEEELDAERLEEGRTRFASPEWKYGSARPLEHSREARFDWGTIRVDFALDDGIISDAMLWSDGLQADFLSQIPALLRSLPLEAAAITARLAGDDSASGQIAADIAALITGNGGTEYEV